jgi:hypothetical protein
VDSNFADTSEKSEDTAEDSSASNKKRIPIKEMIESLAGNSASLSKVLMRLNELDKEDSLPPVQVVWKQADIKKALDGDAALVAKLEKDLNVKLDGTPVPYLSINSIERGIVLEIDIPVKVQVGDSLNTVVGTVKDWYVPTLARTTTARYEKDPNATNERISTFYQEESRKILDAKATKEDVRKSLESRLSNERIAALADGPERLLKNTSVLMNSKMIESAKYVKRTGEEGATTFDVHLKISDEGRRRLWQFSRKNRGFQLLFTVNGIAIAAPRIREELSSSDLSIQNMQDEDLVKEAVDAIVASKAN